METKISEINKNKLFIIPIFMSGEIKELKKKSDREPTIFGELARPGGLRGEENGEDEDG